MKTTIRYAGGKSKAYNIITKHLPSNLTTIISPFIGGGSLESRWATAYQVLGFDTFYALTNYWNVLLAKPAKLADKLLDLSPDQSTYNYIKEQLLCWSYTQQMLTGWKTDYYKRTPIELDELTAATYYFFNHNLSYAPAYLGWMSKIYQDPERYKRMVDRVRHYKNPNLSVGCQSFDETITSNPFEFLYLDPPYFEEGELFKGIYPNANIPVHHKGFNHELLRDLLHNHKGKFILSYNDCPTIREFYKDFTILTPSWSYSLSNGETRIGKNKQNNKPKKSHELLIIKE